MEIIKEVAVYIMESVALNMVMSILSTIVNEIYDAYLCD
jgi:hypothetical protein